MLEIFLSIVAIVDFLAIVLIVVDEIYYFDATEKFFAIFMVVIIPIFWALYIIAKLGSRGGYKSSNGGGSGCSGGYDDHGYFDSLGGDSGGDGGGGD